MKSQFKSDAVLVVDALVVSGLIQTKDVKMAIEIVEHELLALESLRQFDDKQPKRDE